MVKEKILAHDTSWLKVITLLSDLVVFNQYTFQEFLQLLIKLIKQTIPADSYLIYFYDSDKKHYTLIGSKKLHTDELAKITIQEGEGITGWVAKHQKSVAISQEAYKDTRFRFFKELPEDTYESFLSVPIVSDQGTVGVINIQNRLPYEFSPVQIQIVESLVKIIASAFIKIILERKITKLEAQLEERKIIEKAKGILMKTKQLNEEKAYQFIRSEAMKKRKSMKEIAEAILLIFS